MQVKLNTDRNIEGHDALATHVSDVVEGALGSLGDSVTRVEVHLSDENGAKKDLKKGQGDKRCLMEARLQNHSPLAVTAHADTVHQAVAAAADKLARSLEKTLGRLYDHKRRHDTPELDTPELDTPPE